MKKFTVVSVRYADPPNLAAQRRALEIRAKIALRIIEEEKAANHPKDEAG